MLSLSVGYGHSAAAGSIVLKDLQGNFWPKLARGFRRAGSALTWQIKLHLSGPGRSAIASKRGRALYKKRAPFSRLSNYPGMVSGELRRSVKFKVTRTSNDVILVVGPHKVYASINEFGGMAGRGRKVRIPARPYVWPAYKKTRKKIVDMISQELMR